MVAKNGAKVAKNGTSTLHQIFKIWCHDKKKSNIQIRLIFKGIDWFSQNSVTNNTQNRCIRAQNFNSITRNFLELENLEKSF